MAVYKVPQDVEADDKLLGPFSFRQFIYLVIVAIAGGLAFFLFQLFTPLVILPIPVMIFFGALALPLKKDQPMETYLAAVVSFYLKPRRRTWDPDGMQYLVEIVAPKTPEIQRTKDLSQDEASRRLSYLAQIADTQGWAVRGVAAPTQNTSMNDDLYFEAQQVPDILDESSNLGRNLDDRLTQADQQRRQDIISHMNNPQPTPQPQPIAAPAPQATAAQSAYQYQQPPTPAQTPIPQPQVAPVAPQQIAPNQPDPTVVYNPYPTAIHQSSIQPLSEQSAPQPVVTTLDTPESTSEKPVSPGIINLANNNDLSIETIAHEAKRIQQKEADMSEEVVISLH